jgi:hypothetical protein
LEAFGLSKKHVSPLLQIRYSIVGEKEKLNGAKMLSKLTNIEYLMKG